MGTFVQLINDGDTVVGAFHGDPYAFEVFWDGGRYRIHNAAIHVNVFTYLCVLLNLYVPAQNTMKVIATGTELYKKISYYRDSCGSDNWLYRITQQGKLKPVYNLAPEERLTVELKNKIAACELHDLETIADQAYGSQRKSLPPTEHQWGRLLLRPLKKCR